MIKQPTIRKLHLAIFAIGILVFTNGWSQSATITVDATLNKRLISPNIYGKNEDLDKSVQFYNDSGLRFTRLNHGNNATGYNWQKKITVSPDWYNNVYSENWDAKAQGLNNNYSNIQGMFAFQLLGRVASNTNNNFNDWAYNQSQYWSGLGQNLAGGGTPNPAGGSTALVDGNINLFTEPWSADSSVGILDHWFGTNGLGLDKNKFVYWNMDNEVDIWNGTHDWAMPTQLSASAFMDRYIELAKKAKAKYPGIKLCGPVTTSEWQWYKWSNESIYINGKYYPWIEYFIKRCADEEQVSGVRVLDVLDIHNYPFYNNDAEALQGHRIYYDTTYDYPGSNGIRTSTGGWDTTLTKQYIFKRINDWLTQYYGANNGIGLGLSEWGTMSSSNPNLESVIYASHLGVFANNGVELFSPWNWSIGMWETLHLFSKNAKDYSVSSVSSVENTVSAYSSINTVEDAMTVIIVNKDMNSAQNVTVNLNGFSVANGNYTTLQLSSLPATETFVSETQNALKTGQVSVNSNSLTLSVPKLSTTAILLKKAPVVITIQNKTTGMAIDGMYRFNNGAITGQWTYSGSTAQQWAQEADGNYFKFKNVASGLYLDGNGQTTPGSAVYQANNSTDWNLHWAKETVGAYIKFRNRNTGLYLDGMWRGSNSDLGQYTASTADPQLWTINLVGSSQSARKSLVSKENISEESSLSIVLYPNPFSSTFTLKVEEPNKINDISIFDMAGKLVENIEYSEITSSMSIGSSLKPNVYIVQVSGTDGVKSFKIVKK
ncbi:glycoside hydrolase family 44 protein [Flavobacterium sp.]|uniref:glycoside hydrolase family 44 protein n=1 Tax=Flavobacterium sp. TaxID=239 RepID=UPI003D12A996